jgi:xanthine dehydrogenase YagR molybdenum-binding subunit
MTAYIGKPINRVDGRAKVTGEAKYASEYNVPNLAHGYVITSPIAKGTIVEIDTEEALKLPGVLQVFTHLNRPSLADSDSDYHDFVAPPGSPFRPLYDKQIKFSFQPIGLVVAETPELAKYAASLVRIEFDQDAHHTDLKSKLSDAFEPQPRDLIPPPPKPTNDPDGALARAAVQVEAEYFVPFEHHNPMELFATTVLRDDYGKLTVYDKTQGVQNVEQYLSSVFRIPKGDLRVICLFMGGGFGLGLRPQYPAFLAVLAARELQRSVRVSLTRQQMFGMGHRPATLQRVSLGASRDGTLQALIHEAYNETSQFEQYSEPVVTWSSLLYRCNNVRLGQKVVSLDVATPCDMRAPGAGWGVYAIECAMDELAVKLAMDPVDLRLKNYTDKDYNAGKPFSSKELRACYATAAEKFGWAARNPKPRSMRDGNNLIGWGMASGVWDAFQLEASAKAVLNIDGELTVSSATEDIGTGTYTVMTQIAADTLGLPLEKVTFRLGDSSLPPAPVEGGSFTVATVGSAVKHVCEKLGAKLFKLASALPDSPLAGVDISSVTFADGNIRSHTEPARAVSFRDAMRHAKLERLEEEGSAKRSDEAEKYAHWAHSAVFAEVTVDADLGSIHVTRVVSAVAAGRIINPKTARSQVLGGVVWGIGMALEEESVMDHSFGRIMTHNLADYHVPVNADVHEIDVLFVEEHDKFVNPLGAKGLGEIGIVGVAPAIANAIFHATGVRIRELPITLDKVLLTKPVGQYAVFVPAA